MVLQARPLYATTGDSELFVKPSAWDPLVRYVRNRFNVLLQGKAGSGKTSALRQLNGCSDETTYVDAIDAPNALALVERIHCALLLRPEAEYTDKLFTDESPRPGVDDRRPPLRSASELLRELATLGRRLVLLDLTNSSAAASALFSRYGDELWRSDVRWVVAIDSDEAAVELHPSASAFFDAHLTLDAWTEEQLIDLLSRRCPQMAREQIESIVHAASATPRDAIALARRFVVESPQAVDAHIRRRNAAATLGLSATKALAELEVLGEVSASDERLRHRLGWSRERATQVLGDLERHNIVTSRSVRQERGRPRKLYAPNKMF